MNDRRVLFFGAGLMVCASALATQSPIDAARSLLCAPARSAQCTEAEGCVIVTPEANNVPRFMRIDVANQRAMGLWPADTGVVSAISAVIDGEARLLLQGVDGEIPWSAAIDKTTGGIVVSQSADGTGFLIFGTCMPE
jgi:hypothetical protein